MSADRALKQFDSLFQFAPKVSRMDAVDNILPKSYLHEVLPFVNTPDNVSLFYEVKADLSESDVQTLGEGPREDYSARDRIARYVDVEVDEEGNLRVSKPVPAEVLCDV
jgi:hypothetical protein